VTEDLEERALAHAGQGGHVCGPEEAMAVYALAILRHAEAEGATDAFVFPEETFIQYEDRVIRYRNSPEMIEAMDKYLLTGESPRPGRVKLLPP
jgi:hypothetical protein